MAVTSLSNLVNPQVMAAKISAELTNKIRFAPFATIDRTLVAGPGNTITIPTYAYIGNADDIGEGVDITPAQMSTSTATATVKKVGKGIEITDEAVLSGYGDPIGEGENQLALSVAGKIDADLYTAAQTATLSYDNSAAIISYDAICEAVGKFAEEAEDGVNRYLVVHSSQVTQLRKSNDFTPASNLGDAVKTSGVIGMIAGCMIVVSNQIAEGVAGVYYNVILKEGALALYLKRDVQIESDRDILGKKTVITVDEHYVAALKDASKAVLFKNKTVSGT